MDLGQIINSLLGREQEYASVDVSYHMNGSFTLTAERDERRVTYNSQDPYSFTTTSPILSLFNKDLGGPMEHRRMGQSIAIEDPKKRTTSYTLHDKKEGVTYVRIGTLEIYAMGHQIVCSDPTMNDETASEIISVYIDQFKVEQRLLRVIAHKKQELERVVESHSA